MTFTSDTSVLVVSLASNPSPALLRIAIRHAWPVLTALRPPQALREVRHCQPDVIIIQVSLPRGADVELISLLRTKMRQVSLIAVAGSHRDEIERAVRSAGVSCYLPTAEDMTLVERSVAEMLTQRQSVTPTARRPADAATMNQTSSSSFLPLEKSGRRAQSTRRPSRGTGQKETNRVAPTCTELLIGDRSASEHGSPVPLAGKLMT